MTAIQKTRSSGRSYEVDCVAFGGLLLAWKTPPYSATFSSTNPPPPDRTTDKDGEEFYRESFSME